MSDLSRLVKAVGSGKAKDVEAAVGSMAKKYGPAILGGVGVGGAGLLANSLIKGGLGGAFKGITGKLFGGPRHVAVDHGAADFSTLEDACVNPMTGKSVEKCPLTSLFTLAAAGAIAADTQVAANDAFRTASAAFIGSNASPFGGFIPGGFHAFEIQTVVSMTNVAARVETAAHVNSGYFVEQINQQEVSRIPITKLGLSITDGGIVTSGGGAGMIDVADPVAFNRRYLTDLAYSHGLRFPAAFTPTANIVVNVNFIGYRSRGAR